MLEKSGTQTLGLGLTMIGDAVVINEIKPDGVVVGYNAANPEKQVHALDIVRS